MALSVDDKVNLVAIYAAVLSTISILWQIWVWFRTGPRLRVTANTNMLVMGGYNKNDQKYVVINVVNRGSAKTTITHVVMFTYKSVIYKMLNRPDKSFVVKHDVLACQIPYVIDAGCTFMSMTTQNDDMESLSRTSKLYMGVFHSFRARPVLTRIRPIQPMQEAD